MKISWCVFFVFFAFVCCESLRPVPYADVKTIVLTAGKMTTGRRGVYPQLINVGPSYPASQLPTNMLCTNMGWSGSDFSWQCEAQLPNGIDLSSTQVTCESWNPPVGDATPNELMTAGSCNVEYALRGYAANTYSAPTTYTTETTTTHSYGYTDGEIFFSVLAFAIIVIFVVAFLSSCLECLSPSRTSTPPVVHVASSPAPSVVHVASSPVPPVYVSAGAAPPVHVTVSNPSSSYASGYVDGSLSNSWSWPRWGSGWGSSHVYHHNVSPPVQRTTTTTHTTSSPSSSSGGYSSSSGSGTHTSKSASGTGRR